MGDPAGIGVEVNARVLAEGGAEDTGLIIIGDASLLESVLDDDNTTRRPFKIVSSAPTERPEPGTPVIWNPDEEPFPADRRGTPGARGGEKAMSYLKRAFSLVQDGTADGIVTGPVSKSAISRSGPPFSGQTEWFAEQLGIRQPVMGIASGQGRGMTVTRHIPVRKIPLKLTEDRIVSTLRVIDRDLTRYFGVLNPRIGVCGLNPHAGESGTIGREEIDCITPALDELRSDDVQVDGPRSAESLFNETGFSTYDAVVAMYHDQALVPMKARGIDRCVAFTLGLDIVRTSVAHGTGFDLVGTDRYSAQSLRNAIDLAGRMARNARNGS